MCPCIPDHHILPRKINGTKRMGTYIYMGCMMEGEERHFIGSLRGIIREAGGARERKKYNLSIKNKCTTQARGARVSKLHVPQGLHRNGLRERAGVRAQLPPLLAAYTHTHTHAAMESRIARGPLSLSYL